MEFTIKYSFDFETNQYIAQIPELHLSDYGDTIDEAYSNLKAALRIYLEECSVEKSNLKHKPELQYA